MIQGLAHVALYTQKFEETIAFYKRALGAKEIEHFQTNKRGCNLQIGSFILEIFESMEVLGSGSFKHIVFRCDDVDQAYNQAVAQGAVPYIAPKDVDLKMVKRIAFVKGINGEQIEFCELR